MPRLVYLLPLSALLVAALSLLLSPGGDTVFVRVLGGPTDQIGSFRGRIQALQEVRGITHPLAHASLVLAANQGGDEVEQAIETNADGWVEFAIPRTPALPLRLRVSSTSGQTLAQGEVQLALGSWLRGARRRWAPELKQRNELGFCLRPEHISLAVPFQSVVELQVRRGTSAGPCSPSNGAPVVGLPINVQASGAQFEGATSCTTDGAGRCTFVIRPIHHQVQLSVETRTEGQTSQFEQTLLVVPGAFFMFPRRRGDQIHLDVASPVWRDHVWYSLVSEAGRGPGGRLSLAQMPDGTARGQLTLRAADAAHSFLVLASDADGRSPSVVGYPLDGQDHTLDAWDAYLLDGGPSARRATQRSALRVRYALAAYSLASIMLSLFVFWFHVRAQQAAMDRALRQRGLFDRALSDTTPIVVAVLCVFFAFSATLVWIVTR